MDEKKMKIIAGVLAVICVVSVFVSIRCFLTRNKLSKQDLAAIQRLNAQADAEMKQMAEEDY